MAVTDKQRTEYLGIMCDSVEEGHMVYWLDEAIKLGLVTDVCHKPYTVYVNDPVVFPGDYVERRVLKRSTKYVVHKDRKSLAIHQQSYTPDISLNLTDAGMLLLGKHLALNEGRLWVLDVKGTHSGGSHNSSSISFPFKQSMMYARFGVIVQKVVPVKFFLKSWLPEECRYTRVKRDLCKTFLKKDYPLMADIRSRLRAFQDEGMLDDELNATDELLSLWPGVKGVEYDGESKESKGSREEGAGQTALF